MQSAPMQSTPVQSTPLQSTPLQSTQLQSGPDVVGSGAVVPVAVGSRCSRPQTAPKHLSMPPQATVQLQLTPTEDQGRTAYQSGLGSYDLQLGYGPYGLPMGT
jgi:hypothetical protein